MEVLVHHIHGFQQVPLLITGGVASLLFAHLPSWSDQMDVDYCHVSWVLSARDPFGVM